LLRQPPDYDFPDFDEKYPGDHFLHDRHDRTASQTGRKPTVCRTPTSFSIWALEELDAQRQDSLNMDFVCDLGAGLIAIGEHQEAPTLTVNAIDEQQRAGKLFSCPLCKG
jgi:hypothetical protein